MPDDAAVREALETATRAFRDTRGQDPEAHLDPETPAVTQLRKACRLLDACRVLQAYDGYYTSVVELSFGAIERTIQYYALAKTTDTVRDFHDHETVYERGAALTLYSEETMAQLVDLWRTNRSAAYYRNTVPQPPRPRRCSGSPKNSTARFEISHRRPISACVQRLTETAISRPRLSDWSDRPPTGWLSDRVTAPTRGRPRRRPRG